jgi:hypothetical protein
VTRWLALRLAVVVRPALTPELSLTEYRAEVQSSRGADWYLLALGTWFVLAGVWATMMLLLFPFQPWGLDLSAGALTLVFVSVFVAMTYVVLFTFARRRSRHQDLR